MNKESFKVDPRAVVEEGAIVGDGTSVWHFAHVRNGSQVGDNCIIGKDVYIDTGVVMGDGCKVQNGVSIYNGVVIKDEVFIGPHAVFTNDLRPRANIWNDERLVETVVEKGASIGANATIVCGIVLGEWCMIAAGSVVTKDVPPHALVVGVPGRIIDWVTTSGERLNIGFEMGYSGGRFISKETGEIVELKNLKGDE